MSLTRLVELGVSGAEVDVTYVLQNEEGDEISSFTEVVNVETVSEFVKEIEVPGDLVEGEYVMYVRVDYDGKTASSSSWFVVVEGENIFKKIWKNKFLFGGVLLGVLVGVGILIWLRKRVGEKGK